MPFANNPQYEPVPLEESSAQRKSETIDEDLEYDPSSQLMNGEHKWPLNRPTTSRRVSQILAVANLLLFFLLLITWLSVLKTSYRSCPEGPDPPYSKVREDGAVRHINRKFKPELIFQSEPSPEVDKAWNDTMQLDNAVGLPKELVEKHGLPRSIEDPTGTGLQIYGVSAFHQLHCLDVIRRALYPEHYFPNHTHEQVLQHKNHCMDFLRQAIMCNADVTMIYWWNTNYTTIGGDGVARDSDYYLSLSPHDRVTKSFVKWDVEHQCQDLELVMEWMDKNEIERPW